MKLPCGCIMFKNDNVFYVNPCSLNCEYYKHVIEQSKKRGNEIKIA